MLDQVRQRSDGDVAAGDDGLPHLSIKEYTASYEPEEAAGAEQKEPDKSKKVEVQAPALKVEVLELPPGLQVCLRQPGVHHVTPV